MECAGALPDTSAPRNRPQNDDEPPGGVDIEALGAQTRARMTAWSDLGRALCGRFLAAAARPLGAPR